MRVRRERRVGSDAHSRGNGLEWPPDSTGVACFILWEQTAQNLSGALVNQVNLRQIPPGVTDLQMPQMPVTVGNRLLPGCHKCP